MQLQNGICFLPELLLTRKVSKGDSFALLIDVYHLSFSFKVFTASHSFNGVSNDKALTW